MGDGLFIIMKYEKDNLVELMNLAVDKSISLIDNFASLCDDVVQINFPMPDKIGIGITHGSVCCIYNGDKIIDYSGRTLNLAARLMDKARPYGIVGDYDSLIKLLKSELLEMFEEDAVYLRGVSEDKKMRILYKKDNVIINDYDRSQFTDLVWDEVLTSHKLSVLKKIKGNYQIKLRKKPMNLDKIILRISYDGYVDGERVPGLNRTHFRSLEYECLTYKERGNNYYVIYNLENLLEDTSEYKVPEDIEITFLLKYPI